MARKRGKRKFRNLLRIFLITLASLLLTIILAVLLLPRITNMEAVKRKISASFSKKLSAEVSIDDMKISLFPRPGLLASGITIKSPSYKAHIKSVSLKVNGRALLKRKLSFTGFLIDSPNVELTLDKKRAEKGKAQAGFPHIPPLTVSLKNGKITLIKNRKVLVFTNLNGVIVTGKTLEAKLESKASFLDNLDLQISFDTRKKETEGSLKLSGLDISKAQDFFENLPVSFEKTDINLNLLLKLKKDRKIISFSGSAPVVSTSRPFRESFKLSRMDGSVILSEGEMELSLKKLDLEDPQISMKVTATRSPKETHLSIAVLEGSWGSVREKLLTILGEKESVKKLCDIVREARIDGASLESISENLPDLFKLKNLKLSGLASEATLQVPEIKPAIENVSSRFIMENGTLKLFGAEASIGGVLLSNAMFSIDLGSKDKIFYLSSDISSTAERAGSLVKELPVPSRVKGFINRLNLKGSFVGHIVLEGPSKHPELKSLSISPKGVTTGVLGASLPVVLKSGSLLYRKGILWFERTYASVGKSIIEDASGLLDPGRTPPYVEIKCRGIVYASDIKAIFKRFHKAGAMIASMLPERGRITLSNLSYKGPASGERLLKSLNFTGDIENIELKVPHLPKPVIMKKGNVSYNGKVISARSLLALAGNSKLTISGSISRKDPKNDAVISFNGTVGKDILDTLLKGRIPDMLYPKTPVNVEDGKLVLKSKTRHLEVTLGARKAGTLHITFGRKGEMLSMTALLKTDIHEFLVGIDKSEGSLKIRMRGTVEKEDIDRFLENPPEFGLVMADLNGTVRPSKIHTSRVNGTLGIIKLSFPYRGLKIRIGALKAEFYGNSGFVKELVASIGSSHFEGPLELIESDNVLSIGGNLKFQTLDLGELKHALTKNTRKKVRKAPHVKLDLGIAADLVRYGNITLYNASGNIVYSSKSLSVTVDRANMCDINIAGSFIFRPPSEKSLKISFNSKNGDFSKLQNCLNRKVIMEGSFKLNGNLVTTGNELFKNTTGRIELVSKTGKIYRFGLINKIFTFLNPIDVFRGNIPDLSEKGFPYSLLELKGKFQGPYMIVEESQLVGSGLRVFSTGKINIKEKKIDMVVLASALKNIDSAISKIPLLGWVLTGRSKTLLSVPIKVKGNLDNPRVVPASPEAVGEKMMGILKRTFKLPVKIIKPKTE